ncbi:MAG: hypothetical protein WC707_06380 [Candidatus Babeliaceae bacterium]|jgi:hypothetical protein
MIRHNKQRLLIIALTIAAAWTVDSRAISIQDHPYLTAIGCITGITILFRAQQNIQAGRDVTVLVDFTQKKLISPNGYLSIGDLKRHVTFEKITGWRDNKAAEKNADDILDQIRKKYIETKNKKDPQDVDNAFQPLRDNATVERKMLAWARDGIFGTFSKK